MDITVKRSGIACCEKVYEQSTSVEEAVEAVVPDTQPDAEYILFATGDVIIRSKDVGEGHLSITAQVESAVLYSPEGGEGACQLTATVPVSVELDAPGVTAGSPASVMLTLGSIEARLLNPRKVVVRCVVNVDAEVYAPGQLCVSTGLEGDGSEDVEMLTEPCMVSPVVCVKEKTFVVSDEYQLQPGLMPIGNILTSRTEIKQGSVRTVGSRLLFNGTVKLGVLYEAAGSHELCSVSFETEYSQMLDADAEFTSPDCSVNNILTAKYVEPVTLTGGERGISAEFHILAQFVCTDSVRVQCLTDCYSNRCELELGRVDTQAGCVLRRVTVRASAYEQLAASPAAVSVCRTDCRLTAPECTDGTLRCGAVVTVLYLASDGKLYAAHRRLTCEAASELGEGEYAACVSASCAECTATIAQGGFDVRVAVDFELVSAKRVTISQIECVTAPDEVAEHEYPSVTVIRARDGDTLWMLGKRYHSTAALISDFNSLADGENLAGRVLLIPRG